MKNTLGIYITCFGFVLSAQVFKPILAATFQNKKAVENFYDALSSADTLKINTLLQKLAPLKSNTNNAYAGALMMKKSDIVKLPKYKLKLFKEGRILLDSSIAKDSLNGVFRFLRLVIQENCPAMMKYHNHIREDADLVKKNYQQFAEEAKQAVIDYSKKSAALKSIGNN